MAEKDPNRLKAILDEEAESLARLIKQTLLHSLDDAPQDVVENDRLARVWLADRMVDAARLNRGRVAATAEMAQERVGEVARALGQKTAGNGRNKAPEWLAIRDAQRAADLAGVEVTIQARGLSYSLTPRPWEAV
ncbi:hypothetical protein O3790_07350 [Micrococcus luteus]|uniref:hypothetical protein n=1 Tax=Micrococcus luteus TaxID=1270 RepID=UPI00352C5C78